MRNLKRALSLALASIMLLGMMVTGVGAASTSFTDFDQIVNQEAAEVTSGLRIFDGYTDGSFGPENVVTRAEMAVIICKLLNGSDVDPGNFTGISKFTDVPAWAEGYVNYCAAAGIVVGVGEGKFNPSATVTTVEAATMLLKALGYFTEEDKLKEDWKTVVTGRATTLGLYGNLVLKSDEGLSRDNVAELVFHTLFAQRVAYDDNRQLYVKNTNRDVVVTNGTQDYLNTFAENTFHMWVVDGLVTANSYTNDDLSETTNNAPRTNVVFDEAAAQDYPATAYQGSTGSEYPFEYTTGLDMIGHAARVYYSMDRNAPVVYAIVDRATKVEYITYNGNATRLAEAANDAGFRRNTINAIHSDDYLVNYDWDVTVKDLKDTASEVNLTGPDINKTLIVISNSTDSKVDYVIVLDQYLDTMKRVVEKNGVKEYDLTTIDGDDQNIAHDEFSEGDYVVVTDIGKQGDMFNLNAPELVSASVSKITGVSDKDGTVKSIVADGTTYVGSPVADHRSNRNQKDQDTLENTTNFENAKTLGDATLILDFQGKCIGLAEPEAINNYAYAAQFGVRHITNSGLNTKFQLTVELHFQDGTSGVYIVNTSDNKTENDYFGKTYNREADAEAAANELNGKGADGRTYTYSPYKTYTNDVNGESGLGVYRVILRGNDSAVLTKLGDDVSDNANNGTRLIQSHSTIVMKDGSNLLDDNKEPVYQTNKTVYFYVAGEWGNGLSVGARTGIANAKTVSNSAAPDFGKIGSASSGEFFGGVAGHTVAKQSDSDENGENDSLVQILLNATKATGVYSNRRTVEAVMVYGIDLGGDSELYFYKEGNYHITHKDSVSSKAVENDRVVTYDLYKADGEMFSKTYDNDGKFYDKATADSMVVDRPTGWYKIGGKNIDPVYTLGEKSVESDVDVVLYNPLGATFPDENIKNVYVLNAETFHDEFQENIYTTVDKVGGIILSNAKVIDTIDCGLDSVNDIARACAAGHLVRISYTYGTTGGSSYQVKTIFITGFTPDAGNKVSSGSGKNLVVNYDKGHLDIFIRNGQNPTDATIAEAVKNELNRLGFQDVTAEVKVDAINHTTWEVVGWLNGIKHVFNNNLSVRYTAEVAVNGKFYYVHADELYGSDGYIYKDILTAADMRLSSGSYSMNITRGSNDKGDKFSYFVTVTKDKDGKLSTTFYNKDKYEITDEISFEDLIKDGDVVVFTTVNNFKPESEPVKLTGTVENPALEGVDVTFNTNAVDTEFESAVGKTVIIKIKGVDAPSRATVTTFVDDTVYTVVINGENYESKPAKGNEISVEYTVVKGVTEIKVTDILEAGDPDAITVTVPSTVTITAGEALPEVPVTVPEGTEVTVAWDVATAPAEGTVTLTLTLAPVPEKTPVFGAINGVEGTYADGVITYVLPVEGEEPPAEDGELPPADVNADTKVVTVPWYNADKTVGGPEKADVLAKLADALKVEESAITLIMNNPTSGVAQVGETNYTVNTQRYWKVSVKDNEAFVYVVAGGTAVTGLDSLAVGNYIAGDAVQVATGSQISVTTAGSATVSAVSEDTVLTPAALVDATTKSFSGAADVLEKKADGSSDWEDVKGDYVAFGQNIRVTGVSSTDDKYVQLFLNDIAQGEATLGAATGKVYANVTVGVDNVKDGKIVLDEKAGYKVMLNDGTEMGIASISGNNAVLETTKEYSGKVFVTPNTTLKAHLAKAVVETDTHNIVAWSPAASEGAAETYTLTMVVAGGSKTVAIEEGVITLVPATKVVVGTGLTMNYKYTAGATEITPDADLSAETYYVAEGAVVTVKGTGNGNRIDVTTGVNGTPVPGTPTTQAPSVEKTVASEQLSFALVQKIAAVELGAFTGIPTKGAAVSTSPLSITLGTLDPVTSVTDPVTDIVAATTNPAADQSGNYGVGDYEFTVTLTPKSGFYFASTAVTPTVAGAQNGAYTVKADSATVTEDGKLSFVIQVEVTA